MLTRRVVLPRGCPGQGRIRKVHNEGQGGAGGIQVQPEGAGAGAQGAWAEALAGAGTGRAGCSRDGKQAGAKEETGSGAGQGRACAASWRRSRAGFQNQELFVFIGARGQQKARGRGFQESGGKWSPESNAPVKAHRCRSQFQGARGLKTKQAGIETAGRQRISKPTKRGETGFRSNPATRGHGNTEYPGPGQGGM